ncbi:interleukin-15 receptor subunit alpha isoform X3 [Leptonychotes weddellii]|uniref:Interleukin-15 receptor subunit alpha n=1 Tax=Leptonychotes weddellii TaxID=9713 RepID=A0A7F8QWQ5_LEPWE|nr:interleukin-15 receptor subunit alpha isoform X3 [Leptonychotes weddellii]
MSVEHADIRVKSYNVSSRERYTCNSGFKRKAGTSSLTECVFNKTMNVAQWTIPNLKCIKPAFTSTSDTTVATKPDTVPGSRPMPSKPPATGTTGPISQEPFQAPPQTTAKALERTPSASQETPGTYSYNSGAVTVCLDIMEEEAKGMSLSLDSKCSVTSLAQGPLLSLELGVCRRDSHSEEKGRGIMKAKLQLTSTSLFHGNLHTCRCARGSMCGASSGLLPKIQANFADTQC